MIHYFFGEDTYAARQEIDVLAQQLKATIRWLDREDIERQPLSLWLDHSNSSLFGADLLVIRDASAMPKSLQEHIVEVVHGRDHAHCVVWDRAAPDKRLGFYKGMKGYAKEFVYPRSEQLSAWLVQEARDGEVDASAARLMIERLGSDRWQLLSELERLLLMGDAVTVDMVQQHVAAVDIEEQIFAMLDALTRGNLRAAVSAMEVHLQTGVSEHYILSMLAYQFRALLAVKTGRTEEAGIHQYAAQKYAGVVRRFSVDGLVHVLTKIMATDVAIKQGSLDARTGLTMLVLTLS